MFIMISNFAYLLIMDVVKLVVLEGRTPGRAYPAYEQREPGFARPYLEAYTDALTTTSYHGLSHDLIQRIHRLSMSHFPGPNLGNYRNLLGNFDVFLSSEEMTDCTYCGPGYSATPTGMLEFISFWLNPAKESTHALIFSKKENKNEGYLLRNLDGQLTLSTIADGSVEERVFDLKKKQDRQWFERLIRDMKYQCTIETMGDFEDGSIQKRAFTTMDRLIKKFQQDIVDVVSNDEKLRVIVTCVQRIAQCHPFEDGNIRTCNILLNKLLKDYGLPLTLLINPNHFDCCDIDYLIRTVKNGQLILSNLLEHTCASSFHITTDDSIDLLQHIDCPPYDIGEPLLVRRLCSALAPTSLVAASSAILFPPEVSVEQKLLNLVDSSDPKHESLRKALSHGEYALAFRNACVKKIYPLIVLLAKSKDTLGLDVNAPSSNGNTALDWFDHNPPALVPKEHGIVRGILCTLGCVSRQPSQDSSDETPKRDILC
jgi:hypothetical protein